MRHGNPSEYLDRLNKAVDRSSGTQLAASRVLYEQAGQAVPQKTKTPPG